jgi:hypothetical protein
VQRVAWLVALAGVAAAGLAAAYVVVGPAAGGVLAKNGITICHATSSSTNPFVEVTTSADGVLSGHAHHPDDIIPPFEVVLNNGAREIYPGKNMDKVFGAGYTGAELLANGCRIPSGRLSVTTVPAATTEPGRTIATPGTTEAKTITEKAVVPAMTTTAPATSTVVTIPPETTTTVTLPERTVTVPPTTETIHGERIERPAEVVTLPGTTTTETSGASTTVVTVSGPDKVVENGEHATKEVVVTVTTHSETVQEPAQVLLPPEHHIHGETVTETAPTKVTEHATTITVPGTTTTVTEIERLAVPATTATVSDETTVVTVPPGSTTTVTLPEQTVTVPSSTETVSGETVVHSSEVVTLPATTSTVIGDISTKVVTVTAPNTVVEGGSLVTKRVVITVKTPSRVVRSPARVVSAEEKRYVIVVRVKGCAPGTVLVHGTCSHTGPRYLG